MAFSNAFFLSYRHRPVASYQVLVDDINQKLRDTIMLSIARTDIFRDTDRLTGGQLLEPTIALNLCESACMVMLYIPPYFDEFDTYCAREYRAMLALEEERLAALGGNARNQGLIIPVVCKGWNQFPKEIKDRRTVHNFEIFLNREGRLKTSKNAMAALTRIGDYIAERFLELNTALPNACQRCSAFALPPADEVRPWVKEIQTPPQSGLPGRNGAP